MSDIANHWKYLQARYDAGTANVFEMVDSIARHLAQHGESSAECTMASLVTQAVENGGHEEACSARFEFLQYVFNQLNSGATLEVGD